ncbi:MAG: OmpA family protein [Rhodoferax sp.]|uniref:OmpA family protein n=1 Tax=Rhodoferax sp. TaxID=50421 RepID=UPI0026027A22|nr:OmpA family protein [Rhodoferax sp.]MDD2881225.1 OmpA family protein [Rhodoferax sp.]
MNRWLKRVACLSVAGLLSACAPASRVILLPQDGGKPSAVEVKTATASQVLSAPYQTASVSPAGDLVLGTTEPQVVQERYGSLLAQKPPPEELFVLYFEPGGSQLTAPSQALLPTILRQARARKGGEIVVVAHTDRVGSVPANDALSLKRAQVIRELFVVQGFAPALVDAVGRGERSPLVPTDDEVDEPQNRRADIIVR